jgi:6-phosphofructokinase 2
MLARPILTVTLNPAVDEAVSIERFALGEVNRCGSTSLDAGGKGLNASRVLRRLGRDTLALGFVGGVTGEMIRARLDLEGVPHAFDDLDEMTRLNVMLYERTGGRRTRLYLPGARVEPALIPALLARLERAQRGDVVVLGGSLPPGLAEATYHEIVTALRARGVLTVVDASGKALARALAARPALIKPNVEEAGEVLGRTIAGDADALAAAFELRALGAERVVISQGAAGAVGVDECVAWKAVPPAVEARSTVGSGDSMVAGLAIALHEGFGLDEGLRIGTAAGAGTVATPGMHLCLREDFERLLPGVVLRALDFPVEKARV